MEIKINDSKISNFRDLVNSNSNFICQEYQNQNGKNLWNLICSCMDWLTVSTRHLENLPDKDDNIDVRVMRMFSLISSIDLVSESITQLHRVFINPKTLPFSGDRECFSDRLFDEEDDNTYFKSIRACFGAHPVNLNNSGSRRFASWPFDSHMNSGELTVHLYSNKVGEADLSMHLNASELSTFLIKRYNYLDVISSKINQLFEEFKVGLSKKPIATRSDPLEMLYILRDESKIRLDNDYYNGVIGDLIIIFEASIGDPELEAIESSYKKSLLPLIDEIKKNLQRVNIEDLENNHLLSPKSALRKELSYELGKFYSWVYGEKYDPLLDYYLKRFNTVSNDKFNFSTEDSDNVLFLKLKLMLSYQLISSSLFQLTK
ncbi:hypothetical protein [Moritella viscosa]|uniref:Uncharacterized protein n=1 Tax=Moritella viscosa TaxID=80854 RepID=A0A1K9ZE46_9GAMM|nr:hypothetical protein [Moritella viscosa]SGY95087.1 Putative uncharacterized protein [Moritella viscosa]